MSEVDSVNGNSGNKLRTYALLKRECMFEPYLDLIHDVRKRVLFMKFRCGVAPLRIETGRYEFCDCHQAGSQAGLAGESRLGARATKIGLPVDLRVCECTWGGS